MANKLVTFLQDVYPYCKGDVRRLETSVLADIDKIAKVRKMGDVYAVGDKDINELEVDAEAGVKAAKTAIRQGLPSGRAAVNDLDVVADHEEKTILGSGKVGVAVNGDDVATGTTDPAGQAAETIPAIKSKKAVAKSNASVATTTTPDAKATA